MQTGPKGRHRAWLGVGCGLALCSCLAPAVARASEPVVEAPREALSREALPRREHRLEWRWRQLGAIDHALTVALTAGYLSVEFGVSPPDGPRWRGGILFDRAFRRAVVGDTRGTRDAWNTASDVLALVPQGMMVIDSLFVPLLGDDWNTEVAWHLSVIAAQSEALAGLLARGGHYGIARQRPDVGPCREDPNYSKGCFRGETAGFPGGHVASAFVGAGVICAHHVHLPLYGGGFWDTAACVSNLGIAAATGYARMVADRHYVSDTLVGAAMGAVVGFVLPSLVHYRGGASDVLDSSRLRWTIAGAGIEHGAGLGIYAWF